MQLLQKAFAFYHDFYSEIRLEKLLAADNIIPNW